MTRAAGAGCGGKLRDGVGSALKMTRVHGASGVYHVLGAWVSIASWRT